MVYRSIPIKKMTRFNFENSSDDGTTSKINEAWLKLGRIDRLQDTINKCRINPLIFNTEHGVFNYQIILNCLTGLMFEVYGKLGKSEKDEVKALVNIIEKFMRDNPVHEFRKGIDNGKGNFSLNENNWLILKKWLFEYEQKIRELLSMTGFDSPNFEDDLGGL